jgi:transposase InsO family protein
MLSRPRTPADNATIESFFATIKGQRLYHGTYSNPIELISDADAFSSIARRRSERVLRALSAASAGPPTPS